ncbi:hypothetical protein ER308_02945 [Egibacter rhizosphaerae]|uniref:Uncharacterized protein n=1 Tax=Egibacter rhizosphaerae TaxID=1670831 RepID=A0A411YBL7_9ACTN|nr:hypothetical protein [Egibacter rhizosphaerae]QBI18621.1 hypothetical protein ER308_02945 [Egibacter rhizosphaerae]
MGDLDLLTDADQEAALRESAGDWIVELSHEGTELWASAWIARLSLESVDVDVIGGMALHHPDGVIAIPARTTSWVNVEGASVPVGDPALWWVVYRSYKPEKARLLERVVPSSRRAAVLAEVGLPSGDPLTPPGDPHPVPGHPHPPSGDPLTPPSDQHPAPVDQHPRSRPDPPDEVP